MKTTAYPRRSIIGSVLISLLAVTVVACASRTVNQILADPSRYRDREVRVSGTVEESLSFASQGVYRVADDTGTLWVVSNRGVPRKGARVSVKGRIRDGFNLGGFGDRLRLPAGVESGLVMVETSHRARD